MLRELAQWMAHTGGPLDAMDASVASLDRMWEWYIGLAHEGFRGLTEGLVPASWPELAFPLGEQGLSREIARQSHVAGDRLMHYVRLVLTRLVPGAHWDVFVHTRGPREAVENETALFFPRVGRRQPRPAFLDNVGGMASRVIRRQEVVPPRLRNAVGEWSPVPLPASQDPHPTVLLH